MAEFIKIRRDLDGKGIPKSEWDKHEKYYTLIELVRKRDIEKVYMEGAGRTDINIVTRTPKHKTIYTFTERYESRGKCIERIDELLKLLNDN